MPAVQAPPAVARPRSDTGAKSVRGSHPAPASPHKVVDGEICSAVELFRIEGYAVLLSHESAHAHLGSLSAGSWLINALAELAPLVEMGENWDGYGAPAIRPAVVVAALMFLQSIAVPGMIAPAIVATGRGNVQLEWHRHGVEIDVEISGDAKYEASCFSIADDVEFNGNVRSVDPTLARAIARLEHGQRS
jgi:hypothetical protein